MSSDLNLFQIIMFMDFQEDITNRLLDIWVWSSEQGLRLKKRKNGFGKGKYVIGSKK